MSAKLHINAQQGVIDVEGSEEFVTNIYHDFKEAVISQFTSIQAQPVEVDDSSSNNGKQPQKKKARKSRKQSRTEGAKDSNSPSYTPKMDRTVDITGLQEFYSKYEPKNIPERILLFAKFLTLQENVENCSADAIYTCFMKADGKKMPRAYKQALVDTRGSDKGFIDYQSYDAISITHIGELHFMNDIPKAGEAS